VSNLANALLESLDAADLRAFAERLEPYLARSDSPCPDRWLSTAQAADYLGCSPDRLHDLVARRALTHGRDGRRLLFRRSDLDAYAEGLR
jgi:excisionase family DNA binding protein